MERTHQTGANSIRAQLIGANIDIRCWPYCFDHTLCQLNANSCVVMDSSRLEVAFICCDNLENLKYFASWVWCHPLVIVMPNLSPTQERDCFLVFFLIQPILFFTTIMNPIVSKKPATPALMKALLIFLYNISFLMSSTFKIPKIVLSF